MLSWSTCSKSNILNYLIKEVSFSLSIRPRVEDKLGNSASQEQVTDIDVTANPKGKSDRAALNDREMWPCRINSQEHGLSSKVHFNIQYYFSLKWGLYMLISSPPAPGLLTASNVFVTYSECSHLACLSVSSCLFIE